jgi:hypothetical protein
VSKRTAQCQLFCILLTRKSGHHISTHMPHPPKRRLTHSSATAVARGAVLRAFNKERGPRRYARSSYGILRTEIWKEFPEHAEGKKAYDPHDGQPYAFNTIDWMLRLVGAFPSSNPGIVLLILNLWELGANQRHERSGPRSRTGLDMHPVLVQSHVRLLPGATPVM